MIPSVDSFPSSLDSSTPISECFSGFNERTFDILEELRQHPHIEKYRELKKDIHAYIKAPFAQFRDDLVVHWVLPYQLPLETERNVFSRLLKNDFGKGGCHHHMWLAFYRSGLRRLKDIQLAHTLRHNGFSTSLYVGDNAPELLGLVKKNIYRNGFTFLSEINKLLEENDWVFRVRPAKGDYVEFDEPLNEIPEIIANARGIWWRSFIGKDAIVEQGDKHLTWSLSRIKKVWSLYLLLLSSH